MGIAKKSNKEEAVDRISDLPDVILCKILSLLPTKHAVGSSILSKRWKNLDPFDYAPICLDIDDYFYIQPNGWESRCSTSFVEFVDKLLNQTLRDVPCVDKLTLTCEDESYGYDKIVSWVSAAIKLNVKSLILVFHLDSVETLFQSLNGCTTLGRLELGSFDTDYSSKHDLIIPDDFSLPALKQLYLCDCLIDEFNTGSINELINGCPVLEELEIAYCDLFRSERGFSIESPLLKCLTIKGTSFGYELDVELNAPNLKVFTFSNNLRNEVPCGAFVSTFKSLTATHIDFDIDDDAVDAYEDGNDDDTIFTSVRKIIYACSSTKQLYISSGSITALCTSSIELPQFLNLTRLSVEYVKFDGWTVFACLLKNAPMLEHLTFEKEFKAAGFENFERLMPNPPTCLELHMKSVEFKHFEWKNVDKALNYFVQNGKVLEKIVLNSVVLPIRK